MKEHLLLYLDKFFETIFSRRFQAIAGAVALIIFQDQLGLTEDQLVDIRNLVIAWVVSEGIRNANQPSPHVNLVSGIRQPPTPGIPERQVVTAALPAALRGPYGR